MRLDLEKCLRQLFPEAPPIVMFGEGNPWTIRDDGDGPYISDWNMAQPRPTVEQLENAALPVAKADKWDEIKKQRDQDEFGLFLYKGMVFDGDAAAKSRLTEAALLVVVLQMQGDSFQTDWTLADNSVVTLTGDHIIEAGMARALHVNQVFEKARLLRERIFAPEATLEDVQAIDWNAPLNVVETTDS